MYVRVSAAQNRPLSSFLLSFHDYTAQEVKFKGTKREMRNIRSDYPRDMHSTFFFFYFSNYISFLLYLRSKIYSCNSEKAAFARQENFYFIILSQRMYNIYIFKNLEFFQLE